MVDKSNRPIEQYQLPKMVSRIGAAALDLAIYILLSLIIFTIAGVIVGKSGTSYSNANALIDEHIKYSKLAKEDEKNGYVAYSGNDILALNEDNQSLIIERVSYFYCSYLTGNNIQEGLKASLDTDKEIKINGNYYLPENYYTVSFFNEEVLGLPKPGEIGHSDYFLYQKNGEENDYTKIGVISPDFIEEVQTTGGKVKRLKNELGLTKKLNDMYNDAIKVFYNQKSIRKANDMIKNTNIVLMLISFLPTFLIFYVLLPLLSPFGQTIGKRILSLGVTDDKGYLVKKWRTLLRAVPLLGLIIYICLINSLYYQLLVAMFLLLVSMGILVFTPRRRALHDIVAGTAVIKLEKNCVIYEDEAHYEQALLVMKERDEHHG